MSEAEMMMEWEEEQQGFHIYDDGGAAWAVRKMREANEEYDSLVRWYQSRIEIAEAKRDATIERMTGYLQEYAEMVPMKENLTQRSYPVPGGKLVLKKATKKMEHDDEVILKALKKKGRKEYIKTVTTEKLDWAGLKKELQETGEIIDGVKWVNVPESFTVQIDKEG